MLRKSSLLSWIIRIALIIWIFCIVAVVALTGSATKWFAGTIQDTSLGNSNYFMFLLLGTIGLGCLTFLLAVASTLLKALLDKKILKYERGFRGILTLILGLALILSVLPLFIAYRTSGINILINKLKQRQKINFSLNKVWKVAGRLFVAGLISVTLLPVWIGGYLSIGILAAHQFGYIPEEQTIVGTGSMYPTWPKGEGKDPKELAKQIVGTQGMFKYPNGVSIAGRRLFSYQIDRGDIIVFENDKTREITNKTNGYPSGFIKRVIALSGDTLELRGGIVYLNEKPLIEPYTAKPHSTFGESFLKECQKITVPTNSFFAMGDNRKGSGDSREIGPVSLDAIKFALPLNKQKGVLDKNWRDTSKDLDESTKIRLDKQRYLDLFNQKRKEAGAKPLKYQPKLESSAEKRGKVILKYNDFSFEATKSGYPMARAMSDSGYSNIVYGEAPQQGYYEAEELIENQFEFPETKSFLLNKDYQDIGISEVEGDLNGCPTQLIVQHFAGYMPPNYPKGDIESWRNVANNLNSIIPSWENAIGWKNINQDELNKLLGMMKRERNIASAILAKMEANKWLSKEDQNSIDEYNSLSQQSSALADKLNNK